MSKIHFINQPFMARVDGKGAEPIKCTAVVYDEFSNCGVAIVYPGGGIQVWGLLSPRNLITAWRGTEVLRRLNIIGHGTLCNAYYTGVRNPHDSDMESRVLPTIALIGRAAYDEIMSMPVPEEIVRAIIDNQQSDCPPNLYPITEEVRAGTIQWRQEFAEAGIKHPDEIDAEERSKKATIARFERLLASYARSRKLPRDCNGMWNVEGALLTLVDQDAEQTYAGNVLVALAGVVSEIMMCAFASNLMGFAAAGQFDTEMHKTRREAIKHSATWLASKASDNPWWHMFLFWQKRKSGFTHRSAEELLRNLLDQFLPAHSEEATHT